MAAWRAWWAVRQQIEVTLEANLIRFAGLSCADYNTLDALSCGSDIRVGDLAAAVSWERSRLSHHLGRMEKRGLVSRHPDKTDRRGVVVRIEDPGRELHAAAMPIYMEFLRHGVLDGLEPDDLAMMMDVAARLDEHLTHYRIELEQRGGPNVKSLPAGHEPPH